MLTYSLVSQLLSEEEAEAFIIADFTKYKNSLEYTPFLLNDLTDNFPCPDIFVKESYRYAVDPERNLTLAL